MQFRTGGTPDGAAIANVANVPSCPQILGLGAYATAAQTTSLVVVLATATSRFYAPRLSLLLFFARTRFSRKEHYNASSCNSHYYSIGDMTILRRPTKPDIQAKTTLNPIITDNYRVCRKWLLLAQNGCRTGEVVSSRSLSVTSRWTLRGAIRG